MTPLFRCSSRLLALAAAALALTACRPHDFPQYPANYREYAYITNGASGTVTILDVVNVRVDRELRVGDNPVAVAASPTRNEIYVVNAGAASGQGSLAVIDAEHNAVAATIPLHRQPLSIDLDAKGDLAYIANSGSRSISVVDLKARREVAQIAAGNEPAAVQLAPDGKTLVVSDRGAGAVLLMDPATRRIRSSFAGCPGAADAVILKDSSKAFVPCAAGHQVMVLALARPDERPAQPDALQTLMDVGRAPVHLALKPDGGEIFSANALSDSVSEIITNTNDVSGAHPMGGDPVRSLVSRDNALLYVSDFHGQNVLVYSIDDGRRTGSIHVGDGPSALAFSAAGHLLFVVDSRSDDIAVVRTSTNSLFTMLPAGRAPGAIADKAFKVQ